MTTCDSCAVEMDADTHAEELGLCVDCSHRYWTHLDDGHTCCWECVATAALPREETVWVQ